MFVKAEPVGVNKPSQYLRRPIVQVINGDSWIIRTRLYLPWAPRTGATPENSILEFYLSQDRFSKDPLYEAGWDDGIESVDARQLPGLIKIELPDCITHTLRRGQYSFSIALSDTDGSKRTTVFKGDLLVEYEPTSKIHNIPYRED